MVMGIMGNTQGVKMLASPNPNATSRNAPQLWAGRGSGSGGRFRLRVSGKNRNQIVGRRVHREVHHPRPPGGYALLVVTDLVAVLILSSATPADSFLKPELQQKDRLPS